MGESRGHYKLDYKYCVTPGCRNTTIRTPKKIFVRCPVNVNKRLNWLKACRRDPKGISMISRAYVCEDHFNMEEDMENYLKFRLVGGNIKMKANVVPHIFECHEDLSRSSTHIPRPAVVNSDKQRIVDEAITSSSSFRSAAAIQSSLNASVSELTNISSKAKVRCRNVSVVAKPHVRSKGIQCRLNIRQGIELSPLKLAFTRDIATSPEKLLHPRNRLKLSKEVSTS